MTEEKEGELNEYTSSVLRGPETSVKSMIISQHLILSTTSDPLGAVLHICRAAATVAAADLKVLEIDPEEVKILLTLANLFNNPADFTFQHDTPAFNISITSLLPQWDGYFKPWIKQRCYSAWFEPGKEGQELQHKLIEGTIQEHASYAFRNLSPAGYKAVVTDFVAWALPKVQRIAEKVSSLVDQQVYADTLKLVLKPAEVK